MSGPQDPDLRPGAGSSLPGPPPAGPYGAPGSPSPSGHPPQGYPPQGYPPSGYPPPGYGQPWPPPDVAGGAAAGRRAMVALWAGLGGYLVQIGASIIIFASFSDTFRTMMDDINAGRRSSRVTTPVATDPATVLANLLSNVAGIVLLVVGVLFLVWFHKALTNARSLGMRLSHTPGWGVAGFIVPIINFWFPYQSMRDLFPPDHPARPLVGRWWACWLGGSFAAAAVYLTAIFSPVAAVIPGILVAALYVVAAVTARRLISEATTVQTELAAAAGWPTAAWPAGGPGPYQGTAPGSPTTGWQGAPEPYAPGPGAAPQGPPTTWTPPGPAAPPKDPWSRN